jgi:Tfp pilus assembly protein PilF
MQQSVRSVQRVKSSAWPMLLICSLLSACATQPIEPRPDHLFDDKAFLSRPGVVDTDVFALSAAMSRFLDIEISPEKRRRGRLEGLIDALQNRAQLKLEYDSAVTRTAAEAFDMRAGNCLSLVVMTAALAKELGLPVYYQRVYSEDTWARDGDLLFRSGHVNMVLGQRLGDRNLRSDESQRITVDFLPQGDVRGYRTSAIAERTVVGMFMNNRAAESLARGQIDEAYWWAREAIFTDSGLLDAYNTLGVVYRRHGNMREAERVFRHLLEREPENPTVISNLAAVLRGAGQLAEAQVQLQKLQRIEPYPPFHFFDQAQLALKRGDLKGALALFKRELDRNPTYHAAHFGLAVTHYQLGDLASAREHLTTAMQNSPNRGEHELYAAKLERLRAYQVH